MIEIKQLEVGDLSQFSDLLDPGVRNALLDREGRLLPLAFCLGAFRRGAPAGLLAGIRSDTILEVLDLRCSEGGQGDVARRLLSAVKALAQMNGVELMLWSFSVPEEELAPCEALLTQLGWSKPEQQGLLLEVDTHIWDLDDRLASHAVPGQILPLTEVPLAQRAAFLEAHQDSPDGDFTQYSPLIPEASMAYVENGVMLGYLALVRGYRVPELAGAFLPEDKAAMGALITQAAKAFEDEKADRLLVRVHSEMGKALSGVLFRDKLLSSQIMLTTELRLQQEVQA